MQRDEAMFDSGMVEEHQEGFEEKFTDNQGDTPEAK
jgi:hypothetical protein